MLSTVDIDVVIIFFSYEPCRQDIAHHLLERLEDKEPAIQEQVSNLLPMIG